MSKQWKQVFLLAVPLLLALIFSAITVTPALADDNVPPPADSETANPPPLEEPPSGTDVSTEEPAAAEGTALAEEPAAVEEMPAAEEPAAEVVADVLAQLPEGTELVVANAQGEALPLATAEAAEALMEGDPMWCPTGVTPGGAGCTGPQASFSALLPLIAGKTVPGTIWIRDNYVGTSGLEGASVNLDGAALGTTANFALTLQGGWTGVGATVNASSPSQFNVPLNIFNWNANVTLNDILVTAVSGGGNALSVQTTKDIALNRVQAINNAGGGAGLDNSGGTGKVTVGKSQFNNNASGGGLTIFSKGAVTLNDVVASQNGSHGAFIDNRSAATPMAVTINNSVFNNNARNVDAGRADMGLVVYSKGAIAISNLTANNNGNADADVNDGGVWLENTAGTAGVTLTGVNIVSDNEWGMGIFTNGAVTLYNMVNNGNANGSGLYIDNCGWNGSACLNPVSAAVSILGRNEFKFNSRGVYIRSNGAISLNNVTATFNGGNGPGSGGAFLWNALSPISAGVTLTGTNVFSNNNMTGLHVVSKGVVTLNNVTASDNGWYDSGTDTYTGYGAYINNADATTPKAVTLLGTNVFYNNANAGLVVYSKGAIKTNNLSANWNTRNDPADTDSSNSTREITGGVYLDNCLPDSNYHCTHGFLTSSIILSGVNNFNGNGWGNGLSASSLGAISVSSLTANDNGGYGAALDNNWDYWNALLSAYKLPYSGVTILGYGQASNNAARGIGIFSTGAVLTYNLTAQNNSAQGTYINNRGDTAKPVTMNGTNVFENNASDGLYIRSYGAVTVNNITAQGNNANGTFIENCGWNGTACAASVLSPVNLTGSNMFRGNAQGLEVHSKGVITVNNVQASDNNAGYGAILDNQETGATGGVYVKNTSAYYPEFARNGLDGLAIFSNGSILVMDLDAYENGGYGVFLHNAVSGGTGNVNLGTSRPRWINSLSGNFLSGLEVYSNGIVTLSNIQANNNGGDNGIDPPYGYGALIRNDTAAAPKGVTLLGRGEFYNNASGGLYVYTKGAITLANLEAGDNGHRAGSGNGAYLYNAGAATPQAVALSGNNIFNNNNSGGLEVQSLGVIKANNVDANGNNFGVLLNNNFAGAAGGVYLTGGVWTANNAAYGLNVQSKGAISVVVSDAWAGENGSYGWDLNNNFSGAVGGVTLSSPNTDWAFDFYRNGTYGLQIRSLGNIYVAGLDSDWNGTYGAILDNAFSGAKGSVTVLAPAGGNNSFYHNGANGLQVYSNGAITVGGLQANENSGAGAVLSNMFSGTTLPQNVSLTGSNNFHMNGNSGLEVFSYGVILLNNVTANNNGQAHGASAGWGVYAVNCDYDSINGTCSGATLPKGVTLTGVNNFHGNYQDGLFIRSLGAVLLNKTEASNNRIDGAYIQNGWDVRHANVTISGYGIFNGNSLRGLVVYTNGTVAIANLDASGNASDGARIIAVDNNPAPVGGPANVTISGFNNFWGNGGDGLYILNDGFITLSNINANGNGGRGAFLDNRSTGWWNPLPAVRLNLTGVNIFNNNAGNGLEFAAHGNVNMTKVTADSNGGNGVLGNTDYGNITLSCGSMNGNRGGSGYNLNAAGVLTLSGVNGYSNSAPNVAVGASVIVNRFCPLP